MQGILRRFLSAGSLFCLFLFASLALAPAQTSGEHATDREAIGAVLRAQQSAWNRGDVDAFLEGYWHSPELTFSGSSGVARGWDAVLARYKKNYPDRAAMGQLNFSDLESGTECRPRPGKMALAARERRTRGSVYARLAALS